MTWRRIAVAAAVVTGAVTMPGVAAAQAAGSTSTPPRWLVVVLIALAVVAVGVLLAGYGLTGPVERDVRRRLGSADTRGRGVGRRLPLFRRLVAAGESATRRRGLADSFADAVERAGLPVSPGEALAIFVVVAAIAGLVVAALVRPFIGALVAAGGLVLLAVVLQTLAERERRRFDDQLPDTLNLISASLRAGYSLLQSVEAVAEEASEPTAREFSRALGDIRLGASIPAALRRVAARMQSDDFAWAVIAVDIQAEVGGNLSEVLQTAAETILSRVRLRREMRALTAEGRISAVVLTLLPFVVGTVLLVTSPDYLDPLLDTGFGRLLMIGALALIAMGGLWIRRIVMVEV